MVKRRTIKAPKKSGSVKKSVIRKVVKSAPPARQVEESNNWRLRMDKLSKLVSLDRLVKKMDTFEIWSEGRGVWLENPSSHTRQTIFIPFKDWGELKHIIDQEFDREYSPAEELARKEVLSNG